jgi:2-keto-4-pentenoate hydratase
VERLPKAAAARIPCPPVRDLIDAADIGRAYQAQRQIIAAALAAVQDRPIAADLLLQPRIEAEIAFALASGIADRLTAPRHPRCRDLACRR